jgi:sugar/nucleoside kinase (ribokinase family)
MIACLGDLCVDIVSRVPGPIRPGSDVFAETRLAVGGAAANVAVWLARSGVPVTLISRVGDDQWGRWLAEEVRQEGVSLHLITDEARPTCVIQVLVEPDGRRTFVSSRGACLGWRMADLDTALPIISAAEWLYLSGYTFFDEAGRAVARAALGNAKASGVKVALDPASWGPLSDLGAEAFWNLAAGADVLLPNREEGEVLTGEKEPRAMARALARRVPLVILKMDAEGSLACTSAGEVVYHPAPAVAARDSTGAGDAFAAGFLARWNAGASLKDALAAGTALADRHLRGTCAAAKRL